jgi:hypothetical protein
MNLLVRLLFVVRLDLLLDAVGREALPSSSNVMLAFVRALTAVTLFVLMVCAARAHQRRPEIAQRRQRK